MKNDRPGTADEIRHDLDVALEWRGGLTFAAGKPGAPTILMDGDSKDGPSPPETLIGALAGCCAVDVVLILEKRRTKPTALTVSVRAERAEGNPRRVTKVHLGFRITGTGIERAHAERAIELAVTKYCTVRDSLDPEMPVLWSLELIEA